MNNEAAAMKLQKWKLLLHNEEETAARASCEDDDPPGCGCNNKMEVRSPLLQVLQHGIFTHPARPRYHKDTRLRWWNLEVRERNAGDTFTTGTAICMNIAGWQLDMWAPRPSRLVLT
jgi:hypothetical protein